MIPLRALFQKRISGDDGLLRLARRRFDQAGLAAEVYAASPGELAEMLRHAPPAPHQPTVHLPRDIDLLAPDAVDRVSSIAKDFGPDVAGFVVHDRRTMPEQLAALVSVAQRLSSMLEQSGHARISIEYAAGLPIDQFLAIGEAIRNVERVGLCVDTGHVGIRQARTDFARRRPDVTRSLLAMTVHEPGLADLLDDVRASVATAPATVVDLIAELGRQAKPVHFHLHDGHPLVSGLADHFGFLSRLAVPIDGVPALSPLYGVVGLRQILTAITLALGPSLATINLEIHEHDGRLPLSPDDVAEFFPRWTNLANAERQNLWLRELAENALLVRAFDPA